MRPSPKSLLGGLLKFVLVVAAAGAAGLGLGEGLARLNGDTGSPAAATPTTTSSAAATTTAAAAGTTPPAGTAKPVVDVEVLSAGLGPQSPVTGHARVNAEVRVTNRAQTPLRITTARLLSASDEVPLDSGARPQAAALLRPIAAGASATGKLRFTTPSAIAQRLHASPTAHLRIADKTVELNLAP